MSASTPNLTEPAQAFVDILDPLKGLTAYLWERENFDQLPAAAVGVPVFKRHGPDEAESQLHTLDWILEYPISFYLDLTNAYSDQQKMVEGLQAIAVALDTDPSLGGTVFDAAITEGTPFVEEGRARPLTGYQITVAALKLVEL